ncbi:hypothetical protein I4U23_017184 [Adineta vaga]|nr:hypothetical protein I4U23_017184 [Adineta vaga]
MGCKESKPNVIEPVIAPLSVLNPLSSYELTSEAYHSTSVDVGSATAETSYLISGSEIQDDRDSLGRKPLKYDQKNHEDFVVVWLGDYLIPMAGKLNVGIEELQRIVNHVELFNRSEPCLQFLRDNVNEEKIFLIVSGELGQEFVLLVQHLPQLAAIYFFCERREPYETWARSLSIVRGVHDDLGLLFQHLYKDMNLLSNNYLDIQVTSCNLGANEGLNRQDPSFMYAQLLKEILLDFPAMEEKYSREVMIAFCREQYRDNASKLRIIDLFTANYVKRDAILWYTKDGFLFQLLNKALRLQDVDVLFNMRFYLKHLHQEIERQHKQWLLLPASKTTTKLVLFRGFNVSAEEFTALKIQRRSFLSVTSFLSTTRDRDVAAIFAGLSTTDRAAVLLEIEIDVRNCTTPFIDITGQSQFEDERETLFTMGAIFRIQAIQQDSHGLWNVKLKLTGEEDVELRALTEHIRKDDKEGNVIDRLAALTFKMGKYEQSERFSLVMLRGVEMLGNIKVITHAHNSLGVIYVKTRRHQKAIFHFKAALAVASKHRSPYDCQISTILTNLGMAYHKLKDYDKASSCYKESLTMDLAAPTPNYISIARTYNNLGGLFGEQRRIENAIPMIEKALQIHQEVLPANHPSVATGYFNLGALHGQKAAYEQALTCYNIALFMQLAALPSDHPELARTYFAMARTLEIQGKYREALENMQLALNITETNLPLDHPDCIYMNQWLMILYAECIEQAAGRPSIDSRITRENEGDQEPEYFPNFC